MISSIQSHYKEGYGAGASGAALALVPSILQIIRHACKRCFLEVDSRTIRIGIRWIVSLAWNLIRPNHYVAKFALLSWAAELRLFGTRGFCDADSELSDGLGAATVSAIRSGSACRGRRVKALCLSSLLLASVEAFGSGSISPAQTTAQRSGGEEV